MSPASRPHPMVKGEKLPGEGVHCFHVKSPIEKKDDTHEFLAKCCYCGKTRWQKVPAENWSKFLRLIETGEIE